MLSDFTRELLSAAVDGELTPSEKKVLRRVLRESAEARTLYALLRTDSGEIAALAPLRSPLDFSAAILHSIRDSGLRPTPPPPSRTRPSATSAYSPAFWAGLTGIAAVLMVAVSTSYIFFVGTAAPSSQSTVAEARKPNPAFRKATKSVGTVVAPVESEDWNDPPELARTATDSEEMLPAPRELDRTSGVLASQFAPAPEPLEPARIRLSLILSLRDLDQTYPRNRLKEELTRDQVVRVDLFCRDLPRASESVQSALRAKSHQLQVESTLGERLKKPATEVVIYSESMNADEIFALLDGLGEEERRLAATQAEPRFDKFVLAPSVASDQHRLSIALGMPTSAFKHNRVRVPLDPRKPISDATGPQIVGSLGKGSPASPGKAVDRLSVVAPWSPPMTNPGQSKEIRTFFEKRGERKPGNIPLILVLRPIS